MHAIATKPRNLLERRGAVALEFAILAIPFFTFVLFIFEMSYDLFTQEALDSALHVAARQIATGNAQNVASGSDFVGQYLCPAAGGLLECKYMYVSVASVSTTTPGADFWDATSGTPPLAGTTLVPNQAASGWSGGFCNGQPSQMLVVSALYVGPTFLGALLPGLLSAQFNGTRVHATLSTTGFVTEPYPPAASTTGQACASS